MTGTTPREFAAIAFNLVCIAVIVVALATGFVSVSKVVSIAGATLLTLYLGRQLVGLLPRSRSG